MFFRQLLLLLWKNYITMIRRPWRLLLQVLIPVLALSLLAWLITKVSTNTEPEQQLFVMHCAKKTSYNPEVIGGLVGNSHRIGYKGSYTSSSLPSTGPLPFMYSLIAYRSKYCTEKERENTDTRKQFFSQVNSILQNKSHTESLTKLFTDLNMINKLKQAERNNKLCNIDINYEESMKTASLSDLNKCMNDVLGTTIQSNQQSLSDAIEVINSIENMDDIVRRDFIVHPSRQSQSVFCENKFGRNSYDKLRSLYVGFVTFTPNTPIVREIIKQANSTFESINLIREIAAGWMDRSIYDTYIYKDYEHKATLDLMSHVMKISAQVDVSRVRYVILIFHKSMELIVTYMNCFNVNKFIGFETEEKLVNASMEHMKNDSLWAGIVFDMGSSDTKTLAPLVQYKIRMNSAHIDALTKDKVKDKVWSTGPRNKMLPIDYGFIYLQDIIDHAIIRVQSGKHINIGVDIQPFPYPCYTKTSATSLIIGNIHLLLTLAWMISISTIVKNLVLEKEERLKEFMKVMGLTNASHWLASFIVNFSIMFATIIILILIIKLGNLLEHTSAFVLFIFMTSYAISIISFCSLISVFFDKANIASLCSGLIFYLTYLPYSLCTQFAETMTNTERIIACFLTNVAYGFGWSSINQYEKTGTGVQMQQLFSGDKRYGNIDIGMSIVMMLVNAVLYSTIAFYVETVFPGEYGTPRKWYFLVTKSYWLGEPEDMTDIESRCIDDSSDREHFQTTSTITNDLGVKVVKLRKKYKQVVAIDSFSLNFYKGHITSLLGHNGAGKTTTMSILSGLFPATSGTAYIYGMDIRKDISNIRNIMGVCPQSNILFSMLTVEEHLWFFAKLKGMRSSKVNEQVNKFLVDIGLEDKRREKPTELSGGMKRKLSIAMAFIGESKFVMLDEPTAGVDPYSRKAIWDLLLKYKKDCTIILTTHHMDEADVLSDRIAIMSHGKLCCYGTSLYLKCLFGSGYYLTLSRTVGTDGYKDKSIDNKVIKSINESTFLNINENIKDGTKVLLSVIRNYLPNAKLIEDMGSEIKIQLTEDTETETRLFSHIFADLDLYIKELGFTSYGISDTTLEEVFLKVTDNNEKDKLDRIDNGVSTNKGANKISDSFTYNAVDAHAPVDNCINMIENGNSAIEENDIIFENAVKYKATGIKLITNQFHALILKRFNYTRRNMKSFITQLVFPILIICFAIFLSKISSSTGKSMPLELHPWYLSENINNLKIFYSNDNNDLKWTNSIDSLITKEDYAIGNRCLKPDVHNIKGFECKPSKSTKSFYPNAAFSNSTKACDCSSGYMICPKDSYGSIPASRILATTDELFNLTSRNISDWIVKTTNEYTLERYGGFSYGDVSANFTESYPLFRALISLSSKTPNNLSRINEIRSLVTTNNAKVWFNNKGYISLVAYTNIINNVLLRTHLPSGEDPSRYGIVTVNHPLEKMKDQREFEFVMDMILDFVISSVIIIAMSFIPTTFILFLVEERTSSSKLMQFLSGVRPFVYWLSTFTWDMICYMVTAGMCLLIFLAFQINAFVSGSNFPALALLFFLYGFAITPLMYLASRFSTVPSSTFVRLSSLNVIIGTATTITTFIMDQIPSVQDTNDKLKAVFVLFPQYCLGRGLIEMTTKQSIIDMNKNLGNSMPALDPFEWDILGKKLVWLSGMSIVYIFIVILLEYLYIPAFVPRLFSKSKSVVEEIEDVDVNTERKRIINGHTSNDRLTVENLCKTYFMKKNFAVNKLCFGVKEGECFGLLGVNGAGKTTTFKMLTGDISVSSGDAHLSGHSVLSDITSVHKHLGYCPQFDALCPLLSTKEHISLYARLQGLYGEHCDRAVMWALKRFDLYMYRNHIVKTLSGGNKRKLSTAIALVGNPQVIFLDEPTTGMDPKARRFIWKCIGDITKSGRSVILTSHSMEECEALCNRISIMVDGEFKCLGSVQHLKNRFGNGYTVMIHLNSCVAEGDSKLTEFMSETFPSGILRHKHSQMFEYELNAKKTSLSLIFKKIEEYKIDLHIDNYSVCQTSLDQVFINFASKENISSPQIVLVP